MFSSTHRPSAATYRSARRGDAASKEALCSKGGYPIVSSLRTQPSLTTILGFVSLQRFGPDQADQRSSKKSRPCSSSTGATGAPAGYRSHEFDGPPQPEFHSRVTLANGAPVGASGWYRCAGSSECAEKAGGDVFNGDGAMPGFLRPLRHERHGQVTGLCPDCCVRCVMSVIDH
jgi:hypothetical protein